MKWLIRGTNSAVLSAAVVGIFIIVTLFLNSMKGLQFDLSANKKYSLSEQTINTLKELDQDIKATLFTGGYSADDQVMYRDIRDLLVEYEKRNKRFQFEEVDPTRDPTKAQQYQIDQAGTIVFELGDKQKKVYSYQLFYPASSGYAFAGEEKFTQAILELTLGEKRPVYFLAGHNEISLTQLTSFRSTLEGEGYEVKELNLFSAGSIPEDAAAIFIIGPQADLYPSEVPLLTEYLKGNGKLFISLGFSEQLKNWTNINQLLETINVINRSAMVVETARTILNDPYTIVPKLGYHEITNSLANQSLVTIFPLALALNTDKARTDFKAHPLLTSSESAYGETNLDQLLAGETKKDGDDPQGPMDLAYAVRNQEDVPKAVVVGNSQFLIDALIYQQGNRDFVMNSVNWLQEKENLVTIRPREETALQQVIILPKQRGYIFYGTIVVFPLAILALGTVIWWRRRKG